MRDGCANGYEQLLVVRLNRELNLNVNFLFVIKIDDEHKMTIEPNVEIYTVILTRYALTWSMRGAF